MSRRNAPGARSPLSLLAAALIALVGATACVPADNDDPLLAAEAASAGTSAIDPSADDRLPGDATSSATGSTDTDSAERSAPFHPDGFEGITDVPADAYDPFASGEEAPEGFRQLLRRDLIAPVYDPQFVQRNNVGWPDDELVIGVDLGGEARAYPVGFLNRREIVIDLHRGIPTLVTW